MDLLKSNNECPLPEETELYLVELSSDLPARGFFASELFICSISRIKAYS